MIVRWVCGECSSNNMVEETELVTCRVCGKKRTSEIMAAVDPLKVRFDSEELICSEGPGRNKKRNNRDTIIARQFLEEMISAAGEMTFKERLDDNTVRWCMLVTNSSGRDFRRVSFKAAFRDKKTGTLLDKQSFTTEHWVHGTTHKISTLVQIPRSIRAVTVAIYSDSLEYQLYDL